MEIDDPTSPVAASSTSAPSSSGLKDLASADFEQPWVEKYRPDDIKDVVGNEEAVNRLRVIAENGNMPNMILSGPPGIGKTTSVMCLAKALLGSSYKEGVLELNASDERGLEVVRNKIKNFAQKKVTLPPGRHKIVILDEADSMTKEAQQAMRRIMELHSSTTRFVLACNSSTKIIEPIQSRCAVVRFQRLSDQQILKRLLEVMDRENIPRSDDGLEALLFTADGDMRIALNNLQSTFAGYSFVSADNVFKVCDNPHPQLVRDIIDHCLDYEYKNAQDKLNNLVARGYSSQDIIGTFFKVVKNYNEMPEFTQLEFIKEIGNTQLRIADGVQSKLQLSALIAKLNKLCKPVAAAAATTSPTIQ